MAGLARRLVTLAPALALSAFSFAGARTVEIISADRLELRKVDSQDLVVISGGPVELHIDQDVIKARRVEFNRTKRVLTLVGAGSYLSHPTGPDGGTTEQLVTGQNLVVDLGTENLAGEDVIVSSANLEIRGEAIERVPGQLTVTSGYFTPCAKCGRTPNDYAFRARDIRLYPGDRLVAFGATLLLADAPVAYIPAIVLFLREKDRQPQLSIAQDVTDGFTVKATLPFVIGDAAFGNTIVHYYENRDPQFGLGVNLTSYQTFPTLDRLSLYAIAEPRKVTDGTGGFDFDLNLDAKGNAPVQGSVGGLTYGVTATRSDTTSAINGKGITVVDAKAAVDLGSFSVAGEYLDRYGPAPTGPLYTPLKKPEVIVDPDAIVSGKLSADFRVTAGNYTAAVNPANRTANTAAVNGNVTTSRLQIEHVDSYSVTPWSGATFSVQNTFTGRYYGSLNPNGPGGARVVDLRFNAHLDQSFGTSGNTAGLDYTYTRQEGTSPFQFDAGFGRRNISAVLTGSLNVTPIQGLGFTAQFPYDFAKDTQHQQPATVGVNVNRDPLFLTVNYRPNFFTGLADSGSASFGLGQSGSGVYFNASTSYDKSSGFSPLQLGLSYTDVYRTNSVTVGSTFNFQYGAWDNTNFVITGVASRDPVFNPVSFTARQTLYYPLAKRSDQYNERPSRVDGSTDITWRDLAFNETHSLPLTQYSTYTGVAGTETLGSASFRVGNVQASSYLGGTTSWSATYGGSYSTVRGGWTTPTLTGRVQSTRNLQSFGADATVSMPGLNQPITELTGANLSSNYQFTPRFAVGGAVHYSRYRGGASTTTTLNLDSLNFTFGLGRNERPDLYVTTTLRQTLTWVNGMPQAPQPLKPIVQLTLDRCCWALNFEFNPLDRYIRFGLSFPGSDFTPGINVNQNGPALSGLNTLP